MGLFDYIRVEYPLPEGYEHIQDVAFQTKDLDDPYMAEYWITASGLLVRRDYVYEDIPEQEQVPYPPPFDGILFRQTTRRTDVYTEEDMQAHRDLLFYHCERGPGRVEAAPGKDSGVTTVNDWTMYEFIARFTHGMLEYIVPCDTKGKTIRYELPPK